MFFKPAEEELLWRGGGLKEGKNEKKETLLYLCNFGFIIIAELNTDFFCP